MVQTLATADAALKEFYIDPAREQLNNKVLTLAQIERNSKDIEGRRAVLSLHVNRTAGVGARAENSALPTAGFQDYAEERIPLINNYLVIKLTGQTMEAMKTNRGAFVRPLETEMSQGLVDLRRDVNRQTFNDANQTIARCGVTSASTTVQLATATTVEQYTQLHINMVIDIGTTASPTSIAAARTITAIDETNDTITISGAAVTTDATHYVTRQGNAGLELTGLREIVNSSGTLFNVNPTNDPVWKSVVNANGGTARAFTDVVLERVLDDVETQCGMYPDYMVADKGVVRNYAAGLKPHKRFESTDLKGGFKALTVDAGEASLALAKDRDCPANTAFALTLSELIQFEMSDWQWMDRDGAILKWVTGFDAYTAVMYKYHELATPRRNAHARIDDLSTSG